jgi:hypothetical protein
MNQDKNLILSLGGPTKVCSLLGFDKAKGGAQRVQNWMTRGIPPKVKLDYPDLFLNSANVSVTGAVTPVADSVTKAQMDSCQECNPG